MRRLSPPLKAGAFATGIGEETSTTRRRPIALATGAASL
jgi:hypothetical protein